MNINRNLEEVSSNLNGWFGGVHDVSRGSNCSYVKITRKQELEVRPGGMTELLHSHGKSLVGEELLLMDKQRKWFFEMKSTPGEDAVKTVDMKTKYLDDYINLVDQAAAELERTESNFKRSGEGNGSPLQSSCLENPMDGRTR